MANAKQLSKRQLAVIDDIFIGELDEQAVLDKHKIRRNTYNRWQADELFVDEFNRRIASAHRRSAALIARYATLAAAKLVQLTESENHQTARKACLDIISPPALAAKKTEQPTEPQSTHDKQVQQLSPQTASKLLAVLAEQEKQIISEK